MSKEQFAAVAPTKIAEREADRAALYEHTAQRLRAHIEAYPALSPDHDYLKAKCSTLARTPQSASRVNRGKKAVFTW